MPTLRRRRKQSAAEDLSAQEEDTRANQRKNNEPINLLDDDDDDADESPPPLFQYESDSDDEEDCVEVVEIKRPAQKKRKKAPANTHGLKSTKTNKKKTICAARPRNDEEREHSKMQASMWGYMSLPKGPKIKIKKSRLGMVAPPLEPISEDMEVAAPLTSNPVKNTWQWTQ